MNIPDPIERMESEMEALMDKYVDEYTCMGCNKKVDYECYCMDSMGMGLLLCVECIGFDPAEEVEKQEKQRMKDK